MASLQDYTNVAHAARNQAEVVQQIFSEWTERARAGDFPLRRTAQGFEARGDAGLPGLEHKALHVREVPSSREPVQPMFAFGPVVLGAILSVGAVVNAVVYANVAAATLAVVVLAVVPGYVTTSAWSPAAKTGVGLWP